MTQDSPQDWTAATREGATREAMRRWAALPLERIIAAQEEMAELAEAFGDQPSSRQPGRAVDPGRGGEIER